VPPSEEGVRQDEGRRGDLTESIVEEARRSITPPQPAEASMVYWDRLLISGARPARRSGRAAASARSGGCVPMRARRWT